MADATMKAGRASDRAALRCLREKCGAVHLHCTRTAGAQSVHSENRHENPMEGRCGGVFMAEDEG